MLSYDNDDKALRPCDSLCDLYVEGNNWYALKVFYNRYSAIENTCTRDNVHTYIPMRTVSQLSATGSVYEKRVPLSAMLMFLYCDKDYIRRLDDMLYEKAMVYRHPGTRYPTPIDDEEMKTFILVTQAFDKGLDVVDDTVYEKHSAGCDYRVVDGALKGASGRLCRIKGDRRMVYRIKDVIAIAAPFIPLKYLQKIED